MEYATIAAFRRDPVKVWDFYACGASSSPARAERRHHALAGSSARPREAISRRTSTAARAGRQPRRDRGARLDRPRAASTAASSVPLEGSAAASAGARLPALRRRSSSRTSSCSVSCSPPAAIERAIELARGAALLLVVGSSLEVHPVAGLPQETLAAGGRLAIVNHGPTAEQRAGQDDDGGRGGRSATCDRCGARLLGDGSAQRLGTQDQTAALANRPLDLVGEAVHLAQEIDGRSHVRMPTCSRPGGNLHRNRE